MAELIAVDPGNTTGFVLGSYSDTTSYLLEVVNQLNIEEYFETLRILSEADRKITIVCEDFILQRGSAMTSDQISPVYLIGALQYVAYKNRNITLVMQTPAAAKRGVNDRHLEKLSLLQTPKTKWNHANDAIRHAVLYLKNNKHMPTLEGGFK